MKGSIHQEDIIITNIYTPNDISSKWEVNLSKLKEKVDSSTIIVGDFGTQFAIMNRTTDKRSWRKNEAWTTQ